jgi:hypothetical protein
LRKFKEVGKKEIAVLSLAFLLMVAIFYFAPIGAGRDWRVINGGLQRFISGDVVYKVTIVDELPYGYYQVPWIVLILSPLGFLPVKLSYAIISTLSIFAVLALGWRYKLGLPQLLLCFISPPVLYNIWQGHIDIITLLAIFLPLEFWPLFTVAKPQLTGGLGFAVLREPKRWLKTLVICLAVLLFSLLIFGFWPHDIITMASGEFAGTVSHSVFKDLWPIQLVVAVVGICLGLETKDERFFLGASPFLSRYATIGNFVGLTLVALSRLKWWQALAFILSWWIVLIIS